MSTVFARVRTINHLFSYLSPLVYRWFPVYAPTLYVSLFICVTCAGGFEFRLQFADLRFLPARVRELLNPVGG